MVEIGPSNPGWTLTWGYYARDPAVTRVVVGPGDNVWGKHELEPGNYWLTLNFIEERRFGPMGLRRGSRIGRPIYVRAPD